jgi:hypothetical protein
VTAAGPPAAVRRWLRGPLWWGVATVSLAATFFMADVTVARSEDRAFDNGYRVTGMVVDGWNGEPDVKVTYQHPESGKEVRAETYVWHAELLPSGPGPVPLEVSRTDPQQVALAGDRFPATANLAIYAPWALLPFLVGVARRWTLWRTSKLIESDTVAYAMTARAVPAQGWGRRWRLHLYPLDADGAAPPVCAVPLITPHAAPDPFAVEVKGAPRPYGRVVARRADGEVLWPAGRALGRQGAVAGLVGPAQPVIGTGPRWALPPGAGEGPWRGLELVEDRLWYGRVGRLLRRPRLRLEPDALVLVEASGSGTRYRWDDHVGAPTPTQAGRWWRIEGMGRTRTSPASLWLEAAWEDSPYPVRRWLAGRGLADAPWEELPALCAFVAATPAARAGLADPHRVKVLIAELASRQWRDPRPPSQPVLGDRLDLHLTVEAVVGRHVPHFGRRAVRGVWVPPLDTLVAEVTDRLPDWVRPRVQPGQIAQEIARHLATGRWPFDVLLPDHEVPSARGRSA